jgi:hypothetical protein
MSQKNKVLPYIIFGVPIAIGLYFVYKAIRNKFSKGEDSPDNYNKQEDTKTETNSSGGATPSVAKLFPLKKGSKGGKVKELQNAILTYDSTLLGKYGADGDFGSMTEKALQKILGKTSADSQEDIEEINKKAKSYQAQQVGDANRKVIGQKLVNMLNGNKNLVFKALNDTQVSLYDLTSDGREIFNKTIVMTKGQGMPTFGFTKVELASNGMIHLYFSKYKRILSPYAFELI